MILPQYALLLDCADVLKAIDINDWDRFSYPQRRGVGMLGRWVIEKALWSVIVARGQKPPFNASLMELYALSGIKLLPEQEYLLEQINDRVTTKEIQDDDIEEDFKYAYLLANTIRGTAHNIVTILDIKSRKQDQTPS